LLRIHRQVGAKERKRWCSENFVSDRALRKAADIHAQLSAQLASNLKADAAGLLKAREAGAVAAGGGGSGCLAADGGEESIADAEDTTALRRALTSGLAMHGAMRQPDGEQLLLSSFTRNKNLSRCACAYAALCSGGDARRVCTVQSSLGPVAVQEIHPSCLDRRRATAPPASGW